MVLNGQWKENANGRTKALVGAYGQQIFGFLCIHKDQLKFYRTGTQTRQILMNLCVTAERGEPLQIENRSDLSEC